MACGHQNRTAALARSSDSEVRTSEGTGAILRYPRLCLSLDRPETTWLMKLNSISHIYAPSDLFSPRLRQNFQSQFGVAYFNIHLNFPSPCGPASGSFHVIRPLSRGEEECRMPVATASALGAVFDGVIKICNQNVQRASRMVTAGSFIRLYRCQVPGFQNSARVWIQHHAVDLH